MSIIAPIVLVIVQSDADDPGRALDGAARCI